MNETMETSTVYKTVKPEDVSIWHEVSSEDIFPTNGGLNFKYKELQIAVFNFTQRGEWYATQNLCPHKKQMILSRGMIGADGTEPKVACPYHKKTFSLKDGKNLNGSECDIATYPVKVEDGKVFVGFEA